MLLDRAQGDDEQRRLGELRPDGTGQGRHRGSVGQAACHSGTRRLEDPGGQRDQAEGDDGDGEQLHADRHVPAEPGEHRQQPLLLGRREGQLVEREVPHRLDDVGQRVQPGEHGQPLGQSGDREERARQEHHRHDQQLADRHGRLDGLDPGRQQDAERGQQQRPEEQAADQLGDQHRRVGDADGAEQRQQHQALQGRHDRAAEALAPDDRGPRDRRDHHLAQEAELPVPDQRDAGEGGGEEHRRRQDARVEERPEVGAAAGVDDAAQPGAHHEDEQHRLQQHRHHAGLVLLEAQQLAAGDHPGGPQLVGHVAADLGQEVDRPDVGAGGGVAGRHVIASRRRGTRSPAAPRSHGWCDRCRS